MGTDEEFANEQELDDDAIGNEDDTLELDDLESLDESYSDDNDDDESADEQAEGDDDEESDDEADVDELEEVDVEEDEETLEAMLTRDKPLDEELIGSGEEPKEDYSTVSAPAGDEEFTCQSCFLVKRQAQLADKRKLICFDCA